MKWITLVSFIVALASMPASAQELFPHPLKGVKLWKGGVISHVSKFDSDRSRITSEWVSQQMLLAVKANKFPVSKDHEYGKLFALVHVIEVKNNSGGVFAYAWSVQMKYYLDNYSTDPSMKRVHWDGTNSLGTSSDRGRLKTTLRDVIRDQVDEFCAAYYTAN